ncbi:probable protein S-acyltransferase 4 isoform X2 [Pomacea canaliculata]|uniref:probable protein S-acyltransferase 4 isoform X2 n=1 Tax=Pomacea canaliculata TaxID=400727 RepID=UPI000D7370F7|nr:probable protein S-acyltransferase 4 isoform X2 [Pomacea canaliculata]
MEKHYRDGSPHGSHAKTSLRVLFVFQAVTQLYVTLNYLVPFIFASFDPWTQYFLKVFVVYVCIVTCANWLCTICFSSKYVASRDRPDLDTRYSGETPAEHFGANKSLSQPYPSERTDPSAAANGHHLLEVSEKGGMPWHYCSRCRMFVPPRTSHCKFCNVCVLRRDHHCHMMGVCIGHWNQRYFVVLAGYCIIVGYIGAYMTLSWLGHHHDSQSSLWRYFLPYSFYLVLTGSMDVTTGLLVFPRLHPVLRSTCQQHVLPVPASSHRPRQNTERSSEEGKDEGDYAIQEKV